MAHTYKLGRLPHVPDARVPHFSIRARTLAPAPSSSVWYAEVQNWGMMLNDNYGCCVDAAAYHKILQDTTYAGNPLVATDDDVIAAYSGSTGFKADDPLTDEGTVVLGQGGFMEYWSKTGIPIAGKINKLDAYFQITKLDPAEWKKAVYYFGGFMLGFNVPKSIMEADQPPFLWNDPSGPYAGGHEVWVDGYESLSNGYTVFDFISWGARYRMTIDFMEKVDPEIVVPYDSLCLNSHLLDAAGHTRAELMADMAALRGEAS